jgi:hypothetical protein
MLAEISAFRERRQLAAELIRPLAVLAVPVVVGLRETLDAATSVTHCHYFIDAHLEVAFAMDTRGAAVENDHRGRLLRAHGICWNTHADDLRDLAHFSKSW